jgi:hypothetical protein
VKKKTPGQLKKILWKLTSEYVRRSEADHTGQTKCSTCDLIRHWKEMQAGHFIPKAQGNAIYFDLRNINTQCYRCNINLGGNGAEYYPFMLDKHGQEVIDELRRLSRTTVKFTKADYEEMIVEMKAKIRELEEGL